MSATGSNGVCHREQRRPPTANLHNVFHGGDHLGELCEVWSPAGAEMEGSGESQAGDLCSSSLGPVAGSNKRRADGRNKGAVGSNDGARMASTVSSTVRSHGRRGKQQQRARMAASTMEKRKEKGGDEVAEAPE
jgi:hypothetical protein